MENNILNGENSENLNQENSSFFDEKVSSSNSLEPRLRFSNFIESWEESLIGNVFVFQNGKAHEQDVDEFGQYIIVNSKFISSEGKIKKFSNKQICPLFKNDVTMVMSDVPNGKAIAKCYLIDKDNKYSLNQRICALRTEENSLFYLYQINRNDYFLKFDDGVKQTNLKKDDVLSCPIYKTNLQEQNKIADFLSLIDKRIEKQRQLVESLKKYKRGLLSAIFERNIKFSNEEWLTFKIKDLGSFYNGLSGKNKDDFGVGNDEFITYMNVYKNTIAEDEMCEKVFIDNNEKQNKVEYGDILFTQSSETLEEVGFSSVWLCNKSPYLNSFCFGFKLIDKSKISPLFLAYYLRSNLVRRLIMREGQGVTRVNLSAERLKDIPIKIPSITEQNKIANFIFEYDKKINTEEAILKKIELTKKSLLQQMFI